MNENQIFSHALLAAIDASFDREDIEERWKPHGYDIAAACRAASAYEEWAGELISFQDVDDAICGMNITGGLFPERLEAFFAAWIRSANAGGQGHLPAEVDAATKGDETGG
jgi:hypothetical protein